METLLSFLGLVPVVETVKETSGGSSIMGGIPMELMTMLGSSLLGGIMSIWGQSIKAKEANNKVMMAAMTKQAAIIAKKKGEKRGLINDKLVHKRAKIFENLDSLIA